MKKTVYSLLFSILCVVFLISAGYAAEKKFEKVTFKNREGLVITADLYSSNDRTRPVIILFHQYGSSRGEYRKIAPVLVADGFNCLAVDTRAGGRDRWYGIENETTDRAAKVELGSYLKVFPDLVASLNYVKKQKTGTGIILWGSSFSATLVFKLANEYKDDIIAVLSFSPGEYLRHSPGIVSKWASRLNKIPCFVTCGAGEEKLSKPLFDSVSSANKTFYLPKLGRHGSSILMADEKNWEPVMKFLNKVK